MSLQTRLALGLLASLVVALSVQWWVANNALEQLLKNDIGEHLEGDVESILAAIRLSSEGSITLDTTRVDAHFTRPFSGHYYVVHSGKGIIRSRSLWDTNLAIPKVTTGESVQSDIDGPSGQKLLLVTHGFNVFDHVVVVAVAEDVAELQIEMRAFQWRFATLALVILVALVGLQIAWVRRGLRPLEVVRAELRALEKGAKGKLSIENVPREVQPLVQQINRLLEIIQRRLKRSRNALGNLAHALKTPLTALMQNFERPEIAQHTDLIKQLNRHVDAVRGLIERELKRARLVGAVLPTQYYNLSAELDGLIQTLRMVYRERSLQIDIQLPLPEVPCPMDREDLLELLGNLLDNACKWATLKVRLGVTAGVDWCFVVEDDGPGVEPSELERLTHRGVRIDENRAGHGLGLSIVQDLVSLYGGELLLGRSESLGGFRASARISLDMSTDSDRK